MTDPKRPRVAAIGLDDSQVESIAPPARGVKASGLVGRLPAPAEIQLDRNRRNGVERSLGAASRKQRQIS